MRTGLASVLAATALLATVNASAVEPAAGGRSKVTSSAVVDVRVSGGVLRGTVVSSPDGARVPVFFVTDNGIARKRFAGVAGDFAFDVGNESDGFLVAGEHVVPVRVWEASAPPTAVDRVALVASNTAVRGEDTLLGFNPKVARRIAIGSTVVVVAAVALSDDSGGTVVADPDVSSP